MSVMETGNQGTTLEDLEIVQFQTRPTSVALEYRTAGHTLPNDGVLQLRGMRVEVIGPDTMFGPAIVSCSARGPFSPQVAALYAKLMAAGAELAKQRNREFFS